MDFKTLIKTRQSCRKFDGEREVSSEDINYCLEAARLSPSACNAQPYKFTVCTENKAREAADCLGMNSFTKNAPCLIIISENNYNIASLAGSKIKHQDYRSIDIGIAAAHMTLAATDRGLDSCIIGWFEESKLKNLLNIKSKIRLVIAIGYSAEGYPLREKKRKSNEEIIKYCK